jgi:hypothetical protein
MVWLVKQGGAFMSLPSVKSVARKFGIDLKKRLTSKQAEKVLVGAMMADLPEAVEYLHRKAHEAKKSGQPINWAEDPNSKLGKQLIRIHASDAMRPLAEKHFCHGMRLTFVNCCGGKVEPKPPRRLDVLVLQIKHQDGQIAKADC